MTECFPRLGGGVWSNDVIISCRFVRFFRGFFFLVSGLMTPFGVFLCSRKLSVRILRYVLLDKEYKKKTTRIAKKIAIFLGY